MAESQFQRKIVGRIREMFEGCLILKNDANYLQGIPDLLILHNDRWAMLEVKAHRLAGVQPNQDFYISFLNDMSFAAYIYPENEEVVLRELQRSLESRRSARFSKRQ